MPRDKKRAVRRLADVLVGIEVERDGKTWSIQVDDSPLLTYKSTKHALAFLADLARHSEADPESIEYTGTVPSRGLASWEEDAYIWLTKEQT